MSYEIESNTTTYFLALEAMLSECSQAIGRCEQCLRAKRCETMWGRLSGDVIQGQLDGKRYRLYYLAFKAIKPRSLAHLDMLPSASPHHPGT